MAGIALKALYYPYSRCTNENTLKRAILLFDEVWFIDPTTHQMRDGLISDKRDIPKQIMTEWESLRESYSLLFEKDIVHLYDPENIINQNDALLSQALKTDIEDTNVWDLFARSDKQTWSMLRRRIPPSAFKFLISQAPGRVTYGTLTSAGNRGYGGRESLYFFTDGKVKFERDNYGKRNSKKRVIEAEFTCLFPYTHGASLAVSQAMLVADELKLIPLTDSAAHHELLHRKHQRLTEPMTNQGGSQLTGFTLPPQETIRRVSITVFDHLISEDILNRITIEDAVRFREESKEAGSRFREYVLDLTSQIGSLPSDEKYEVEIRKLMIGKVIPEARKTEDAYRDIWGSLFGKISKKAFSAGSPALIVSAFTGFSLPALLAGAAAGLGAIIPDLFDAATEAKKARRNPLSYLLDIRRERHIS